MKMKTTLASLIGAMVIGTTGYSGYQTYEKNKTTTESDLFLENIEALAEYEDDEKKPTTCPSPYDVPDHRLAYVQKTGTYTIDAEGYISIGGKRIHIGGVEGTITVTYEISDCSTSSPGTCCPYEKAGDIKIV